MNAATPVLRKEHDAVLRMLEVTEKVSRLAEKGESLDPVTLSNLLEFFRVFADPCHHGKEEDILFPALENKGMPRHGGPLGVMFREHERGRDLIREIGEATDSIRNNEAGSGRCWAKAARGYISFLREHIFKENNMLFVMAEKILNASEQASLKAAFDRLEEEKMGSGTHERLHAVMGKLSPQFLDEER
jgi:hemerythrin-like domain-containing protein